MVGLDNCFFENLVLNDKHLYATSISCRILINKYNANNLIELSPYHSTTISVNRVLTVTSIPAGHSPGSVMFLFETKSCRILYTGDYRIDKNDIERISAFHTDTIQTKIIDKIYLDTTFFKESYPCFPRRSESLNEICRIIGNYIKRGPECVVNLVTGAYYGYECLFIKIYEELKMPVHVNGDAYNFYKYLPSLDNAVTRKGSLTQIHCHCCGYKQICNQFSNECVLQVKATAMIWNSDHLQKGISTYEPNTKTYSICYSTHASFEEGIALIKYLKPKDIEFCVKPQEVKEQVEMKIFTDKLLKEIHHVEDISKPKLFQTNFESKSKKRRNNLENNPSSEALIIRDSPKKRVPPSPSSPEKDLSNLFNSTNLYSLKSTNNEETSLAVTSSYKESIEQPNMSVEELHIPAYQENENVLFNILNDKMNNNQISCDLISDTIEKHSPNTDDVILDIIDPKNENRESRDVLLDIIEYTPDT